MVKQVDLARVDGRQQVAIEIRLRLLRGLVADAVLAERLLHELAAVVVTKHFGNVVGLEQSCQKFLKRLMLRCQSVISSFGQDVFASIGEGHLHHENPALRFACEIFRKSSGAFWPKHNLISTRSNHTRETLTATPAKDAAPFIVSQLTQDIELS